MTGTPEYQAFVDGSLAFDDDVWSQTLAERGGPGPTVQERRRAEAYLAEHWIPFGELLSTWVPRVLDVFEPLPAAAREIDGEFGRLTPEIGFRPPRRAVAWHAGAPLHEHSHRALKELMVAAGDQRFALIERPHRAWLDRRDFEDSRVPLYRLAFDADSTWQQLNSDRDDLTSPLEALTTVSGDLFTMGREEYLLLGETASWGIVYRGGARSGQCILGVQPELGPVVMDAFGLTLAHDGAREVLFPTEVLDGFR